MISLLFLLRATARCAEGEDGQCLEPQDDSPGKPAAGRAAFCLQAEDEHHERICRIRLLATFGQKAIVQSGSCIANLFLSKAIRRRGHSAMSAVSAGEVNCPPGSFRAKYGCETCMEEAMYCPGGFFPPALIRDSGFFFRVSSPAANFCLCKFGVHS